MNAILKAIEAIESNLKVTGSWNQVSGFEDAVVVVEYSTSSRDCDGNHGYNKCVVFDLTNAVLQNWGPLHIARNLEHQKRGFRESGLNSPAEAAAVAAAQSTVVVDRYDLLELVAPGVEDWDDVNVGTVGDTINPLEPGQLPYEITEEEFSGSYGGPTEEGYSSSHFLVTITRNPGAYVSEGTVYDQYAQQAGY